MAEELQEQQTGESTTDYAAMMDEARAAEDGAERADIDPIEAAQRRIDQLEAEVEQAKVNAREARQKSYDNVADSAADALAMQAEQRVRDLQARVLDAVDDHEILRQRDFEKRARENMAS